MTSSNLIRYDKIKARAHSSGKLARFCWVRARAYVQIVLALAVELNLQERRRDQTAPVPRLNLHAPESPRARHRRSALIGKASAAPLK